MTLRKNKQILIIFVITLLVLVFSTGVISLLMINTKRNNHNALNVSAYNLSDITLTGSLINDIVNIRTIYDSTKYFEISDLNGLKALQNLVNSYGLSFEGKTVTLTADIDCQWESVGIGTNEDDVYRQFEGTFDGDYHTISNISYYNFFRMEFGKVNVFKKSDCLTYGLFNKINENTWIKNLRVRNVGRQEGVPFDENHKYFGGLVGWAYDGSIDNCVVENINIKSSGYNEYNTDMDVCGLFAQGYAVVTNCYVNDVQNICGPLFGPFQQFGWRENIFGDFMPYPYHKGDRPNNSTFINCVGIGYENVMMFASDYLIEDPNPFQDHLFEKITVYYQHNISGCYQERLDDRFAEIDDISSVGGVSGAAWYYAKDYNDGWPYLRGFIKDWQSVSITSNPTDYAQVGSSSKTIYIPSGETKTYSGEILNNGNEAKIVIYDQEVILEAKDKYKFYEWHCFNWGRYEVRLKSIEFTIIFKDAIIDTPNGPITIKPRENITLIIPYGELLQTNKYENQYIYRYIEYDTGNMQFGPSAVYDLGEAMNMYVLESWGLPNGENSWIVGEDIESTGYTIKITPTFKLKEYGWIFM